MKNTNCRTEGCDNPVFRPGCTLCQKHGGFAEGLRLLAEAAEADQ